MELNLLYFAWLRERLGSSSERVAMPLDVSDVAGVVTWLRTRGPAFAAAFVPENRIRCAVNQEFARPDQPVHANDEVAFFPPLTGG